MRRRFGKLGVVGLAFAAASAGLGRAADSVGPMLLADDSVVPHATVTWTQADGDVVEIRAELPYASDGERTALGRNLEGFVALGGSRLERGAGHPDGAIVRLGFYKVDRDLLFFEDIAHESTIEIELSNVRFNQVVTPDGASLIQRLQYKVDDVLACGLTEDQSEMFNVAGADDDMGGAILPTQIRFASLDGTVPATGEADVWVEADGSVSMRVVLPYRLLRHKGDPWALEIPGTFFEPYTFDLEFQVLPREVAEVEGVTLRTAPDASAGGDR